jgi:N-acetylmuramoyl-L-alanine amidase/type II secretory pathway predicted ATPase ExeA
MFLDFFHLREQPFAITLDPDYLYPSRTHCEALEALTESILGDRGFLALIAEPGMGKTTLLYQVIDRLRDKARVAFLFQTQCNSREFFQYLLSELGVDSTGMGLVAMHSKLDEMLFAEMLAGRRFVLLVDEAQNLDDKVLETIRLLSNFETSTAKLLQIVLAGQPQLGEKLRHKQLEQLLQRITVVKHLEALSPEETAGYIRHRLTVAGYPGKALFDPEALALIFERSQGVPRNINKICFRALLEAHARGRHTVSRDIVDKSDRDLSVAAARPLVFQAPSPAPPNADTLKSPRFVATPQLTYRSVAQFSSSHWGLWTAVIVAVLLSAALTMPRDLLRELRQKVRGQVPVTGGLARRAQSDAGRETPAVGESAQGVVAVEQSPNKPGMPSVMAIQASSAANDARVVVMLDDSLQYESQRITSPDRIYFDLYNARLSPSVGQKTIPIAEGLLKWVRAAQNKDGVVRLVLDADGAKDYSSQLLRDPYRLVIDVHAQPTAAAQHRMSADPERHDLTEAPPEAFAGRESKLSLIRELGLKINRIAIDPGHGGYDTGSLGPHGLLEKNLCLDVALRLGQLIEENIADADVIYTRKDDRHVPLEERTAIANNAKADLFISIHANSSDIREARGTETYYMSLASSQESKELAQRENVLGQSSLHELPELIKKITRNEKIAESEVFAVDIQNSLSQGLQLVSRGEKNRGVKSAPFIVLSDAKMPAVLSEISFVSNASDESLLLESAQRQRVAEGLYRGVAAYLDGLHSLPHRMQKLVSENHPDTSPGFESSTAAVDRNPR